MVEIIAVLGSFVEKKVLGKTITVPKTKWSRTFGYLSDATLLEEAKEAVVSVLPVSICF